MGTVMEARSGEKGGGDRMKEEGHLASAHMDLIQWRR